MGPQTSLSAEKFPNPSQTSLFHDRVEIKRDPPRPPSAPYELWRTVVTLRDLEGWSSEEVCSVLEPAETNQRVLLHRGRMRLRAALERYHSGKSQ